MSKITTLVEEMVSPYLEKENLSFWSCDFVKEGKDWFLRLYIDTKEKDKYIGTDECEKVSRFLSSELDKEDPIEQNYYLEVSSPGLDRELTRPEHFTKFIGSMVQVKLYKPLNGVKELEGELLAKDESGLSLKVLMNKTEEIIKLESDMISKVRLAVIF